MAIPNRAVIGTQVGDEGKGKICHHLSRDPGSVDVNLRCAGGDNAGHTVVIGSEKYKLHHLPSGIVHPHILAILGRQMVINGPRLTREIVDLSDRGINVLDRLKIAATAHLIMPWHGQFDRLKEEARMAGVQAIGTTQRGIGPAYTDRASRDGIRAEALLDWPTFMSRLEVATQRAEAIVNKVYGATLDLSEMNAYLAAWEQMADFVFDDKRWLREEGQYKRLLFEGAQGWLLDLDQGSYPNVTSSNTGIAGILGGAGVSHKEIGTVIGVVKALMTRVGSGHFPTEMDEVTGDAFRERGGEFGTTTGRPRRCGWLDLVVVRDAVQANGIDELAVTKLDILSGCGPLRVCTSYKLDGEYIGYIPASDRFSRVTPMYEEMSGWDEPLVNCRRRRDLPNNAQAYLQRIEQFCGVPVTLIGVGAEETEIIDEQRHVAAVTT